jgi:hypothetical protein
MFFVAKKSQEKDENQIVEYQPRANIAHWPGFNFRRYQVQQFRELAPI